MREDDRDESQRTVDAENGWDWREFHTSGPNCHWCYERPAAYVWCPFGTHVCEYCHDLTMRGEEWQVAENLAASMTVRGSFGRGVGSMLDPEHFRQHHHNQMDRWIEVRTHAHPIAGEVVRDPRYDGTLDDEDD